MNEAKGAEKQAFILLRVSSSGQTRRAGSEEGYSIEGQRHACRTKAESLGANVAREFIAPAESASRGFYKTLKELIAALKVRSDIDYVIVYKLERFARDELTDFAAHAEIRAAGAELVSATEQIDSTPQGMLMHGVLTAINAYYSRDLAVKITEGRVTKAKLGGSPGRVPLGYLNRREWDGNNDIRYVEVDEERMPLVQWAFHAYASGDWSLDALADALYKRGLRSRPTPKRPASRVRVTSVHKFLKNPYYIGIVEFKGVRYEGAHPTFISKETFEKVQQVLIGRRLGGDRSRKKGHGHYLVGTVYCAMCGKRLMYTKCTGRHGGKFEYLVCSGRHKEKACDLPYLPVERVEKFVTTYYKDNVSVSAKQIDSLEPRLSQEYMRAIGYRQHEGVRIQKKIEDILAMRKKLVDGHIANPKAIPLDVLEASQAELDLKLKAAEKSLELATADVEVAEDGLGLAKQIFTDSPAFYGTASPLDRRLLNQAFLQKVFVGPGGVEGAELTDAYGALLREALAQELEEMSSRPKLDFSRGSTERLLVELRGLEPLTSSLPAMRSSS
jgi:site-specific DNA recombinase